MDKKMVSNTIKVGLAFALITLFWNVYDFVVPLLLDNVYGLPDDIRGLVMGLDNLLCIFLLPLFGNLSDRTKSKIGKRKPYVLFGTIASVFFLIFVPLATIGQMQSATSYKEKISVDGTLLSTLYDEAASGMNAKAERYVDLQYLEKNGINKKAYVDMAYSELIIEKKGENAKYYHFKNSTKVLIGQNAEGENAYNSILADNNERGLKTIITKNTDGQKLNYFWHNGEEKSIDEKEYAAIKSDYGKYVKVGVNNYLGDNVYKDLTLQKPTSLALYMLALLLTLIAMASFRSPAVALMPDVTPKPYRSQANAIINLSGGIGGAVGFLIYTIWFAIKPTAYTEIFVSVAIGMLALLFCFMTLVNEPKLLQYCKDKCKDLGIDDNDTDELVDITSQREQKENNLGELGGAITDATNDGGALGNLTLENNIDNGVVGATAKVKRTKTKAEKAKLLSFLLILASIFMWFMGYNAVTSNLSVYATKNLLYEPSTAGLITAISMAISAIAFIPVGFLAAKYGRKKTIILGFILTIISFILIFFIVRVETKIWFMIFYLISGFGLIIANVNTFPMVVELSSSKDVGKYTGFYYTATMSAQAITPFIAGKFMLIRSEYLFLYSTVCIIVAVALMCFVKHGDSKPIPKKSKPESEDITA